MKTLKTRIKDTLNLVGYSLLKTGKLPLIANYATEKDVRDLDATVNRLKDLPAILAEWKSTREIRGYLSNDRLNLFLELIDLCSKESIDFTNSKILDVGSRTGYLLKLISERYACSCFGTDIQPRCSRLAKVILPEGTFITKDLLSGPMDNLYDVILCTEVLEHLLDAERSLTNLLASLNVGGVAVITVPNGRLDFSPAGVMFDNGRAFSGHVNFWSLESFDFLLRKAAPECTISVKAFHGMRNLLGLIRKPRAL